MSPAHGNARLLIDRALYLPQAWTGEAACCRVAGVPADAGFATKPRLARGEIARIK